MLKIPPPPEEEEEVPKEEENPIPQYGTLEWIHYWSDIEGNLPSPIDVSITSSIKYYCPDLIWYNFDVYPHKIKLTNTGYTVLLGAKWRTERPYLEGGPFLEKHVFSQIHFHWGKNMMEGSEHSVDKRNYPGEMHVDREIVLRELAISGIPEFYDVTCGSLKGIRLDADCAADADVIYCTWKKYILATFFRSEYMTQEEAFRHPDGVVIICYIIKYGVNPDPRLQWVIEGFPRIREAQTNTRIGPYPMSRLMPMFFEDYFLYWGSLQNKKGESLVVRWLVPRTSLYASFEQMKQFRKLWNPWDEPNLGNFRPLQEKQDRHVLFISPHWSQYNSLLPIPRVPDPSITILSPAYQANLWMLPPQNAYMLPKAPENDDKKEEKNNRK